MNATGAGTTAHRVPPAAATTGLLVMNRGHGRKKDYWLLCSEKFTPEELAPYRRALRRLRLTLLPYGQNARWGKLYPKARIIALLQKETKP
jgi:hypothetical protein